MKIARMISASTMPIISASCWYCLGTLNFAMMMMKMNRLSTEREYSVSHPAKNSVPYWWPANTQTPMPKRIARPTYTESASDTSLVEGSCGRRPITMRSKSRTDIVTPIVVHQTQVGTSMKRPFRNVEGRRRGAPEHFRRSLPLALASQRHRAYPRSGDRDDDTVAKEYSPPLPHHCRIDSRLRRIPARPPDTATPQNLRQRCQRVTPGSLFDTVVGVRSVVAGRWWQVRRL